MLLRTWSSLLPLALIAACHSTPPATVPVQGESNAISRLSGEWSGSYQSPATGRTGSIVFTFVPGENHAHGDVVMVPTGGNQPLRPMPGQAPGMRDTTQTAHVLTIEFVRAAGDVLSGSMAPYEDPECRCAATAVFQGRVNGDVISGTFTTTWPSTGRTANGTWEIRKRQ